MVVDRGQHRRAFQRYVENKPSEEGLVNSTQMQLPLFSHSSHRRAAAYLSDLMHYQPSAIQQWFAGSPIMCAAKSGFTNVRLIRLLFPVKNANYANQLCNASQSDFEFAHRRADAGLLHEVCLTVVANICQRSLQPATMI